ncbi:MBL fold metallo-hydrolase [Alkalihalobacterium elongatum]|uniref:MBL fold metallo-hydrolase n=1 Tax=Alkalihalobacterium elongatum TaxID=2675466 RepID=UPI001C1FBF0F|nr:MBL fold metallo-hydrolase [Alkalihalobacterium elongatum]
MSPVVIKKYVYGELKTNSYVVTDHEKSFYIVIDPGENPQNLINEVGNKKVDYILLTHCHYGHIAGLNLLRDYTGASVIVHHTEAEWLLSPSLNLSSQKDNPIICDWPDILLNGDELIKCSNLTIKAIHTPGHSPGSTCFLINNTYLFSGDTLLAGRAGPTNTPYGNRMLLKRSIKDNLLTLDNNIRVFPGHGIDTTMEIEKKNYLHCSFL